VNLQDPKGVVIPVVRETHSVMACLIQSKTMALKTVSCFLCITLVVDFYTQCSVL